MMLDHRQIMNFHDTGYDRGQVTRERAADDLVFAWITQWDDQLLGESQLQYRGEFNILRKAMRQIIAELNANPIQIDFEPIGDNYNAADLMDGIYRTTCRRNDSIEAFENAVQESVVCGFGTWELENIYQKNDSKQIIKRTPVFESANTVFWDPNAKMKDKSDAKWVSILTRYSEDGAMDLVEQMTGERPGSVASFRYPEESYVFPWVAEDNRIYIGRFYHRETVNYKIHLFIDLMGHSEEVPDDEFEARETELLDNGFDYQQCIECERYQITRYIVTGAEILEHTEVPGELIPVVSIYGERAMVEGEEHFEGITRLAKDPQRLRNFQMSYLADIVSRSPRTKPIFTPEQISGYEHFYEESGSDNNYPYLLQNSSNEAGKEIPMGPVGAMPEQPIPQALIASIELSRQAVEDVANPGLPQNIADPDLSGKAVLALQHKMDMQSFIYQNNYKHGLRRDAEIFSSMAREVYDSPRQETITLKDGSRKTENLMQQQLNSQMMQMQTVNDLTGTDMEVYAEIGTNYATEKQETRSDIKELIMSMPVADQLRNVLMMEYISMMPGMDFEGLREFASKELIKHGIRKPQTDDEMMFVQQLQQQQQPPDPATLAAMAEMEKAEAQKMEGQSRMMDSQTKMFDAQTKRAKVEIEAAESGVKIEKLQQDVANRMSETEERHENIAKKRMDNMKDLAKILRPEPLNQITGL